MKRRKKFLVVTSVMLLFGCALGAACTFPDVSFVPKGSEAGGGEAGSGEAGGDGGDVDAGGDGRANLPPDVDPEGGAQDATTREGGAMIDAAGCTCDCDEDKFQKNTGGCDGGPGPRPDCDDLDDLIKPDAGYVSASWTSPHMPEGDWNCDGARTKQHPYNVKCNDTSNGGANCVAGFNDDPNCGETAVYNVCQYDPGVFGVALASCVVKTTVMTAQGCK